MVGIKTGRLVDRSVIQTAMGSSHFSRGTKARPLAAPLPVCLDTRTSQVSQLLTLAACTWYRHSFFCISVLARQDYGA